MTKYLYLLAAAVILLAIAPTPARAAPANPPNAAGVLTLKADLPGDAALAAGYGSRGRNNRNGDRYQKPDRNRNDQRGRQRNDDHRRPSQRASFHWSPWSWFLRLQFFHGGHGNSRRGH